MLHALCKKWIAEYRLRIDAVCDITAFRSFTQNHLMVHARWLKLPSNLSVKRFGLYHKFYLLCAKCMSRTSEGPLPISCALLHALQNSMCLTVRLLKRTEVQWIEVNSFTIAPLWKWAIISSFIMVETWNGVKLHASVFTKFTTRKKHFTLTSNGKNYRVGSCSLLQTLDQLLNTKTIPS